MVARNAMDKEPGKKPSFPVDTKAVRTSFSEGRQDTSQHRHSRFRAPSRKGTFFVASRSVKGEFAEF